MSKDTLLITHLWVLIERWKNIDTTYHDEEYGQACFDCAKELEEVVMVNNK